jgi:DNA-binding LacI/PurR family transcriptional regulator
MTRRPPKAGRAGDRRRGDQDRQATRVAAAAEANEPDARRPKKYASSIDVARLAGVSQSAVSRTYTGVANVSDQVRQRVLEAAKQLDYRPSMIPRIMSTHRSNLVAIVMGGFYNPFYTMVLEQFTVKLQATGHQVLLVHAESGHTLDSVIPRLASYRVDAIVSALAVLSPNAAEALAQLRIPVISFNTALRNEWVSPVSCDNIGAARAIADLFLARGAQSFGFISGPPTSHASAGRERGFTERLMELTGRPVTIARADYRYEGGFAAALHMFAGPDRPEALFCANDLIAFGAMDALRNRCGMLVPEDVLVAGFDDIPGAAWASYDLTTFVQDGSRMVDEALVILATAEGGRAPVVIEPVIVPARLIERGTTRRAPQPHPFSVEPFP